MRTALAGLGDIGAGAHLPALLRHPQVELAALVDVSAERLDRAHATAGSGVRTTTDLDEVLADDTVDAVVLATPPWVTTDLAIRAVRAGRYVLAEKPVATSVGAAAAYDALTEDETARLQVGLTYRHDPAIETLAGWLRDGRLGRPLLVRAHIYDERRDPHDEEHTARLRRTLAHGTPVVHEGAHVFDWLTVLLGASSPTVDDAWALRTDADLPAPNLVGARLTYADSTVALVEFGWLTDALPRSEVTFLGPRGHAVLHGSTFDLELTTADGYERVEFDGDRTTRCFDRQLTRFVELATGERTRPEPGLAAGRAALETSERVATAAHERSTHDDGGESRA
ncbi:MAG: gfo/Idh/MocA family oxidoreductase [Streptosporangiales bacterium]|nr:gfo/Idh/MocA family oxidoreductase [Streptosporangiales bacterium]